MINSDETSASASCAVFAQIRPPGRKTLRSDTFETRSFACEGQRSMGSASSETARTAPPNLDDLLWGPKFPGSAIKVAMLVYPEMVLQHLVGPQTILNILGADIHLVGFDMTPVITDVGIPIPPTDTPATCPQDLDVLFVPGGLRGTIACMNNPAVLAFLTSVARRARFITSVCTGSLVLAAAGLLEGYKATSHWGVAGLLPVMGAIESRERLVQDRNRITGAGITAGLDFGLILAAQLRGQQAAEHIQLIIDYASQAPFRHDVASETLAAQKATGRGHGAWIDGNALQAAQAAARRLNL